MRMMILICFGVYLVFFNVVCMLLCVGWLFLLILVLNRINLLLVLIRVGVKNVLKFFVGMKFFVDVEENVLVLIFILKVFCGLLMLIVLFSSVLILNELILYCVIGVFMGFCLLVVVWVSLEEVSLVFKVVLLVLRRVVWCVN